MKKLKYLRENGGITCQMMANSLGISKSYYWQLENEKRNLSYEMAVKIALVFKMKPDDIFFNYYIEDKIKKTDY